MFSYYIENLFLHILMLLVQPSKKYIKNRWKSANKE